MAFSAGLAAAAPADEAYWQMVGRQFPLDEKMIYLNAANVCPASRPVMGPAYRVFAGFPGESVLSEPV